MKPHTKKTRKKVEEESLLIDRNKEKRNRETYHNQTTQNSLHIVEE